MIILMTDISVIWHSTGLSKREIRWSEFPADFHFSTLRIPGNENSADLLTRQGEITTEAEICSLEFSLDVHPDYAEEISKGYLADPEFSHILRWSSVSKDDVFHDRYFWDEAKEDFTRLKRPRHGFAFPNGPFDLSYSRRITIVLSRVIKAGIGHFGICREISTGQAWENPLRSLWSHVNPAREVNRGSWKSVCCSPYQFLSPLGTV